MAKSLNKFTRLHIYGGDCNEMRSYALIGYNKDNDAAVTIVREKQEGIDRLLKRFGNFDKNDLSHIKRLCVGQTYQADHYSQVIRLT